MGEVRLADVAPPEIAIEKTEVVAVVPSARSVAVTVMLERLQDPVGKPAGALIFAVEESKLIPAQRDERLTADPFWLSVQTTVPILFEAVAIVCEAKLFPTTPDTADGCVVIARLG